MSTHKHRVQKEGKRRKMVWDEKEGFLWERKLKK